MLRKWLAKASVVLILLLMVIVSGEDASETGLLTRCIESGTERNGFGD